MQNEEFAKSSGAAEPHDGVLVEQDWPLSSLPEAYSVI